MEMKRQEYTDNSNRRVSPHVLSTVYCRESTNAAATLPSRSLSSRCGEHRKITPQTFFAYIFCRHTSFSLLNFPIFKKLENSKVIDFDFFLAYPSPPTYIPTKKKESLMVSLQSREVLLRSDSWMFPTSRQCKYPGVACQPNQLSIRRRIKVWCRFVRVDLWSLVCMIQFTLQQQACPKQDRTGYPHAKLPGGQ